MQIDEELRKRRKRKLVEGVQEMQNYLKEQEALDKQNATGKLGQREVKRAEKSDNLTRVWEQRSRSNAT